MKSEPHGLRSMVHKERFRKQQLTVRSARISYAALNAANSQGESTAFVAFMLSVIRDTLRERKKPTA